MEYLVDNENFRYMGEELNDLSNDELRKEMKDIEQEFESLKNAVIAGAQRLEDLSKDYKNILDELNRRKEY